jgi:hypothetical protein
MSLPSASLALAKATSLVCHTLAASNLDTMRVPSNSDTMATVAILDIIIPKILI